MKVLLSYESYYNQGKQYQAKFIYDNIFEVTEIKNCIQGLNDNLDFHTNTEAIYINGKQTNAISRTNIPKEVLIPFITLLLKFKNTTIIIGNKEFTKENSHEIEEYLDNLHINISLKKGKYFNLQDCFYVTFKYSNEEQRSLVSYDFTANLKPIMAHDQSIEQSNYLFPFIVDKSGNMTFENTGIIGGTNIPNDSLIFFLSRFINEYDAVIHTENGKIKSTENIGSLLEQLKSIEFGKSRIRK